MPALAIAIIRETSFGDDIKQYLKKINTTLVPYSGIYRVHGGPYFPLEGDWQSDLVIIEFPDLELARAWYASPAYLAIRPLRQNNTEGELFLVCTVSDEHKAADILTSKA